MIIIHVSSEAARGESRVKITAPITRMVQLHPTPHPSSTLPADILQEVSMDQPSQNSCGGRTEEGLEVGGTPLHLLHQAEMPVCSSLQLLPRSQSRLSSKSACAGSKSVALAPTLPSREGTMMVMLEH